MQKVACGGASIEQVSTPSPVVMLRPTPEVLNHYRECHHVFSKENKASILPDLKTPDKNSK